MLKIKAAPVTTERPIETSAREKGAKVMIMTSIHIKTPRKRVIRELIWSIQVSGDVIGDMTGEADGDIAGDLPSCCTSGSIGSTIVSTD